MCNRAEAVSCPCQRHRAILLRSFLSSHFSSIAQAVKKMEGEDTEELLPWLEEVGGIGRSKRKGGDGWEGNREGKEVERSTLDRERILASVPFTSPSATLAYSSSSSSFPENTGYVKAYGGGEGGGGGNEEGEEWGQIPQAVSFSVNNEEYEEREQ